MGLAIGVAGCVDQIVMTPANEQAQAIGSPKLNFLRGIPGGVMKVTMPDGESLPGSFSVSETTAPSPPGTDFSQGGGNFYATARGPRTSLVCHANMIAGHGGGLCRDQNGAIYQLEL